MLSMQLLQHTDQWPGQSAFNMSSSTKVKIREKLGRTSASEVNLYNDENAFHIYDIFIL